MDLSTTVLGGAVFSRCDRAFWGTNELELISHDNGLLKDNRHQTGSLTAPSIWRGPVRCAR